MTWTTPEPHPGICCWNAAGWLHQQWGNDQWMLVIVLSTLSIFLHFIPNQIWAYYRDTIVIFPEFFRQDLTELNAPTRLAKAQGGPLKFLTNPLRYSMVPAGHWCAKIRCAGHTSRGRQLSSRGDLPQVLASVMGKVWEIHGNIWKYDDYTIGFRDVEIVSLLDKPILGENDGFFRKSMEVWEESAIYSWADWGVWEFSSLLVFGDPLVSKNGRSESRVGGGAVASHDAGWMIQAVCRCMLHKWPQIGSNLFFI